MPIVTFTSDFGTSDHYVARVKATLLSINPNLCIVDISHDIEPFDIAHMAFVLSAVYQKFPAGTVHLIGSNGSSPKVDTTLISEINGHYFIAPDNGVVSLLQGQPRSTVFGVSSEKPNNFNTLGAARLACSLAEGSQPEALGTPTDRYVQLMLRQVKATRREIAGHVVRVDHYGNLITNIKKQDFDILSKDRDYTLQFGRERVSRIHESMLDVDPGEAFYIFNELGLLQIGINQGDAAQLLGLSFDSPVNIQFED
jgi:S-adenosylmethionine hydrolase